MKIHETEIGSGDVAGAFALPLLPEEVADKFTVTRVCVTVLAGEVSWRRDGLEPGDGRMAYTIAPGAMRALHGQDEIAAARFMFAGDGALRVSWEGYETGRWLKERREFTDIEEFAAPVKAALGGTRGAMMRDAPTIIGQSVPGERIAPAPAPAAEKSEAARAAEETSLAQMRAKFAATVAGVTGSWENRR